MYTVGWVLSWTWFVYSGTLSISTLILAGGVQNTKKCEILPRFFYPSCLWHAVVSKQSKISFSCGFQYLLTLTLSYVDRFCAVFILIVVEELNLWKTLQRCHCCRLLLCVHSKSSHCRLPSVHWRRNCFADRTTTHTSGNSSIDTWHELRTWSFVWDLCCREIRGWW